MFARVCTCVYVGASVHAHTCVYVCASMCVHACAGTAVRAGQGEESKTVEES